MTSPADGLLLLLAVEPTLLPAAPAGVTSEQIQHRTQDEVHSCLRCGQQAQVAYVADTQIRPRWLDLCFGCSHWLRGGLTP